MLQALVRRGARVQIAQSGRSLPPLTGLDLILVDLAHGSGLNRARVTALNRRSGHALVVALHHGALAHERTPGADLAVEGFVHADAWQPLLDTLGSGPIPAAMS